jgi:hypothetical protein
MPSLEIFIDVFLSTVRDVLPIATILVFFQFVILRRPLPNPRKLLAGFGFVLLGLMLFLIGLEQALFPMGRLMAAQFTDPAYVGAAPGEAVDWTRYYGVYAFAFAVGFATTVAEPALIAVADQFMGSAGCGGAGGRDRYRAGLLPDRDRDTHSLFHYCGLHRGGCADFVCATPDCATGL